MLSVRGVESLARICRRYPLPLRRPELVSQRQIWENSYPSSLAERTFRRPIPKVGTRCLNHARRNRCPRKFRSPDCPLQEVMFLVVKRTSVSWTMHGQTSRSMLLQLLPGAESENRRWSTIGSDEWLLNTIVLRNSYLAGPSIDRVRVGALLPPMNF